MFKWFALPLLLFAVLFLVPREVKAGVIVTIEEVGQDVVVNGTGMLDTSALTGDAHSFSASGNMSPAFGSLRSAGTGRVRNGASPMPAFGDPSALVGSPQLSTGNHSGIITNGRILVPLESASTEMHDIDFTMVYQNRTIENMGLFPGSYVSNWGSGANADSYTINVVPEPASLALLAVGSLLLSRRLRM